MRSREILSPSRLPPRRAALLSMVENDNMYGTEQPHQEKVAALPSKGIRKIAGQMPFGRTQGEGATTARDRPCRAMTRGISRSPVCEIPHRQFAYRVAASAGTANIFRYSSSLSFSEAAATFCSRCSIEEVPGIGSMVLDRRSSQASATCVGLAL